MGGVSREIRVELDPARLLALNATASDISRQLRQIQQEASGGRADIGGIEQSVRTIATVQSADELAKLDIALADGRRIRLDQVATVTDTVGERRSTALLNGTPVVGFEITRSRGAGEIDVAEGVRAQLAKLQAEHPDIQVTEAFNFVDPVEENFDGSMWLLIEGAVLAVLVVWLFLRDWRATMVSAAALPLSILPTFGVMYLMGFSLNVVTLLSLSLVVGHPGRRRDRRDREYRAPHAHGQNAVSGSNGGGRRNRAGSDRDHLHVDCGVPAYGLHGRRAGQVFRAVRLDRGDFGVLFAGSGADVDADDGRLPAAPSTQGPPATRLDDGLPALGAVVPQHRIATSLAAAAFFFGSFSLVPMLATGFIPPDDLSQTQVYLTLAPGSTFNQTLTAAEQARAIVEKNPHVKMVYTAVGGGAAGSDPFAPRGAAEARKATLTLNLTPRNERRGTSKQDVERELREALTALPGVRVNVGFGGSAEKYILVLAGENGQALAEHARVVERELRTIQGIGNVTTTASLVRPELIVRPDFAKAADLGVTSAAIADTLRIATAGDYDQGLAKLNLSQRQIPIVVKLPPEARQDRALLERLPVPGRNGPVMLGNVAQFAIASGPARDRSVRPAAQHQFRD